MRSLAASLFVLGIAAIPCPAWAQSWTVPPPTSLGKDNYYSSPAPSTLPTPNWSSVPTILTDFFTSGDCNKCPRVEVFGDVLYWRVSGADVGYAQPFDGTKPPGPSATLFPGVPEGPVGVVSPGFTAGFRAGAGYALTDHSWLVATFTYFQDTSTSSIAAPNGQVLSGNVVFPNTVTAAFLPLSANASYTVNLLMGDLDYKCAIIHNDCLQLYWLAGVRYAHLEQNLTTNYAVFGTTTVNTGINFDGGGPRIGLEGECRLGCGFYGYAKGTGNLLVGQFDANYLQTQTFAGQQALTHITDDRVVPILEAELGVGWRSPKGRVSVSAGYYVGSWFNTLTTPSLIQGIQNNNYTTNGNNFRDTLNFDGLFGRVEFRF